MTYTNLITYRKGEYQILCFSNKDGGDLCFRLRIDNINTLDKLVSRLKTENFQLTDKIPKDIRNMLLKYGNVR